MSLKPRYDRISALIVATTVLAVSLLGGVGLWPVSKSASAADQVRVAATTTPTPSAKPTVVADVTTTTAKLPKLAKPVASPTATSSTLPANSGTGRRIVFSITAQRVWLVGSGEDVEDTYLVSGSVTDNLKPGTYSVYSRSRYAVGIDDSGNMEYFVRFTRGANAAIGFHSIPELDGTPLQTEAQLGTPQSHGCIRQKLQDAAQLWDWAPIGTEVVVLA